MSHLKLKDISKYKEDLSVINLETGTRIIVRNECETVEAGSLKCSHSGHEELRQSSSVALRMSHYMAYHIQYNTGNNW